MLRWALAGTALLVLFVMLDVRKDGGSPLGLVQAGERGPSVEAFHRDFPHTELPDIGGHDGQQFYAVARAPMHPTKVAPFLDRPRYRLQRPLYPVLAWALHPTGGGTGLVYALFAVGVVAAIAGGLAMGAISTTFGGPAWMAAAFPLLPGTYAALRISTSDALAVALAFGAIALSLRRRPGLAVVAAVAAVLTKEPAFAVLVGFALWRRDREGARLVTVPIAFAGVLWVALKVLFPDYGTGVIEFVAPLRGLRFGLFQFWLHGTELMAALGIVIAVGFGVAALVARGMRSPFGWIIAAHLTMVVFLSPDVLSLNFNATRATLPLLVAGVLALVDQSRSNSMRPALARSDGPVTSAATP
jgi:hypothetical protein